ncbi:MAG: CcmD family protein [Chloroflexi bacterium]|nr:CcmD family protein [Chloroflexota bacterium]
MRFIVRPLSIFGLAALAAVVTMAAMSILIAGPVQGADSVWEDLVPQASPAPQADDDLNGESELPWLFAVFFITWAAFFAYVFVMSRRQREMRREIDALSRALADRETSVPTTEGT